MKSPVRYIRHAGSVSAGERRRMRPLASGRVPGSKGQSVKLAAVSSGKLLYPRARKGLTRHSSPISPGFSILAPSPSSR